MSHTSPYGITDELSTWYTKSSVLSSSSCSSSSFGRGLPCTDLVGLFVRFFNGPDRYTSVLHLAVCWIDLTPLSGSPSSSSSPPSSHPYPRFSTSPALALIDLSSLLSVLLPMCTTALVVFPPFLPRLVISVMDLSILHLGTRLSV